MAQEKTEGLTAKKEEDFSEWYTQVVQKAELADYSSVSGCIIFKPYSYAIWEKIKEIVDKKLKVMGVKNVYFPLLIPEDLLTKEKAHIKGFAPEVAWVTHAGDSKLEKRLAVRPTSETIMYDAYAKWIRSWRDLPLKLNQWNNVVRWEFKHPIPFLRTREFLWNEGHTVFAAKEEAEKEAMDILLMYNDVLQNYMALHAILGRKTDKEKFAGAEYTLSAELFMPNGKAIQGPDSHHDGQNFAKAFNITFLDKNEKRQYAWQNTWAITTRMIGVMISIHGDDRGLVLPPNIAPYKIVIIPILFKENQSKVNEKVKLLHKKLKAYDAVLDDRDYTPGWKFHHWELKGVPIRIEVGPKDIEKKQVVLVRRDNGKKEVVKESNLIERVDFILEDIQKNLLNKSKKLFADNLVYADNMEKISNAIEKKKFIQIFWCGRQECEDIIKEKNDGAKILNIPLEQPKKIERCSCCKKDGKFMVHVAKSY